MGRERGKKVGKTTREEEKGGKEKKGKWGRKKEQAGKRNRKKRLRERND
jgi:hypothetical protein